MLLFDLKGRLIRNFLCACEAVDGLFGFSRCVSLRRSLSLCLLLFFLSCCVWLSESVKIVLLDLMNLDGVSTPLQVRSDDRALCLHLVFFTVRYVCIPLFLNLGIDISYRYLSVCTFN